ncbi:hypothetical protein [Xanthomonas vesicatoria]|uniref:hypothetical protein n=1 Tax=Xanthomonas vesicatoria TaxID=56460 RepID=UPI000AC5F337|nr:hypothetical protein [Xanthomonas vesicatoria]MCC8559961.1 hypothetical protein [Xanthomonas vesicatoria]MCC8602250.1 hypothetical protein [Xanthomonas vesicatoria]MCC8611574.1 hypothetical protein [Xanthomonas vesicatoria]MCC8673985.1 hypothetical protein [Xanthomonas vesicatoria]MCC8676955.1 hypothetical protein [Xanthomonas vesicatoria]
MAELAFMKTIAGEFHPSAVLFLHKIYLAAGTAADKFDVRQVRSIAAPAFHP